MKISKDALKRIMKEELQYAEQQKDATDVQRMLQYIDGIDNYKEYGQLLQKILLHNVDGKEMIMKKLLGPQITTAIVKKISNTAEQ